MAVPTDDIMQLLRGQSRTPHDILGLHAIQRDGTKAYVVRARVPRVTHMWVLLRGERFAMESPFDALYERVFDGDTDLTGYQFVAQMIDGSERTFDDPYRFWPTIGEVDLHLYGEGRHMRLWEKLGAHPKTIDGVAGTAFAVWAPNAKRVSVIGAFNGWDGRAHPMRMLGSSGVFEIFIPGVQPGDIYKYEIRAAGGATRIKTDPLAFKMEQAPGHASIVVDRTTYTWQDASWMARRSEANPVAEPMLVYEVHLGSWRRDADGRMMSYRQLAPLLAAHVKHLGFTHIELLPILEHPFGGSWGYQVGGYFAPTSRHGTPDDFRFFVDTLHQAGIGVILDWVPAHFPKDDWALRRFDGTACYEHEDPRLGDHPEWGTHIFNYARHEVRNFLLANALYWVEEFHIDGLRVDAVASMLYLDYGREAGQWLRNRFGGRENLEAVALLKTLNHTVRTLHPGVITVAEESTTWPRVTHPIVEGGLGFTFKWNMGWMHDTLDYFKVDPFFRPGAHDKLTFAMMYEYSERFVNPLSHDEVVHMKGSLLRKMPGDEWQRLANLRVLIGYSIARPGKSLFFMGTELGPWTEWNDNAGLEWDLLDDPRRRGLMAFVSRAGALYGGQPSLWRHDHHPDGFRWIDVADKTQSVLSFARFDGAHHIVVVMNLTPMPREHYRLGAPARGTYRLLLNSDSAEFGGSGGAVAVEVATDSEACHGFSQSIVVALPPLSIQMFVFEPGVGETVADDALAAPSPPKAPKKTAKKTAKKPAKKPAKQPVEKKAAEESTKKAEKKAAEKSTKKAEKKAVAKSTKKTALKPAKTSVEKSAKKAPSKRASTSVGKRSGDDTSS